MARMCERCGSGTSSRKHATACLGRDGWVRKGQTRPLLDRVNARRDVRGWDECWPRVRGSKRIMVDPTKRDGTEIRRAVWFLEHGSFPEHYQHLEVSCGNALCLNPRHIYRQTEEQRFWVKVDKSAGPLACWPWKGSHTKRGYGVFHFNKKSDGTAIAHRHAWLLTTRTPLPSETFLCHHCDNPICVNPAHMFPGTPKDNMHDMLAKGRAGWQKAKAAALETTPSGCVAK